MYILTEIFFTFVAAFILGVLSFILAATVVLVKSGFRSSVLIARRIGVQVTALGWDRQAESHAARVGSLIS